MFIMLVWIFLLGLPLLIYLGFPVWSQQRRSPVMDAVEAQMHSLFLERERSYSALADLDEDYEAGKLSEADYRTLRGQLLQETAEVVAQLEASGMTSVEEEIARYKKDKQSGSID